MKKPPECTCNPAAHKCASDDLQLLRRVRRQCLASIKNEYPLEPNPEYRAMLIKCASWTAWQCFERLKELKGAAA